MKTLIFNLLFVLGLVTMTSAAAFGHVVDPAVVAATIQSIDIPSIILDVTAILAPGPVAAVHVKELRAKRVSLAEEARKILDEAGDKELSAEQEARFNAIDTEVEELRKRIEREERLMDLESELNTPQEVRTAAGITTQSADERQAAEARYSEAFDRFLRGRASADDMQALITREVPAELRDQMTTPGAAGGFLIPEGFYNKLTEAVKAFGGMRESGATILNTGSGNRLPMPTVNDADSEGAIIGEGVEDDTDDIEFGQKALGAYMYTSKIVRVSLELLQDSAFDVEGYLAGALGTRIARVTNRHFTTGTGTGQPQGVVVGSTVGITAGAGHATSITADHFVDLEHSVDPAYRARARWMFHDTTLREVKKLKDGNDRPLWLPGLAVREPDTILSKPFTINQHMPEMAAGARSVLFGDFSNYHIRDVRGIALFVFRELYMAKRLVGFMTNSRHDAVLLDAGANPIKAFQNTPS